MCTAWWMTIDRSDHFSETATLPISLVFHIASSVIQVQIFHFCRKQSRFRKSIIKWHERGVWDENMEEINEARALICTKTNLDLGFTNCTSFVDFACFILLNAGNVGVSELESGSGLGSSIHSSMETRYNIRRYCGARVFKNWNKKAHTTYLPENPCSSFLGCWMLFQ